MSATRLEIAIVGAGGLAAALARLLSRGGEAAVTVASRRPKQSADAVRGVRGARAVPAIGDAVGGAAIVILAVPDRAIETVARALVPMRRSWRGVVVLHAAGAYGPERLLALHSRGAATGVLHPLAVAGAGAGGHAAFRGAFARIEGSPKARLAARQLCALAGLLPLRGDGLNSPTGRRRYHAAASLASNDVVALIAAAHDLLIRQGVSPKDAIAALTGLAEGAIAQVRGVGLAGALTGPVARNDGATLVLQLRTLLAVDPPGAAAHRALSLRLIELCLRAGRLDQKAARGLRTLLVRGRGRSGTI